MASGTGEFPPTGSDQRVRWLYAYWQRKHPAVGCLPGRQHIDPLDFPQLLRWVWLADVQAAPLRFKFRLIGSEHVALFGKDYTGHWLDEVLPAVAGSPFHAGLEAVARQAKPYYERSASYFRYRGMDRPIPRPTVPERLLLPLARDGQAVDMILALTIPHPAPDPAPDSAKAD